MSPHNPSCVREIKEYYGTVMDSTSFIVRPVSKNAQVHVLRGRVVRKTIPHALLFVPLTSVVLHSGACTGSWGVHSTALGGASAAEVLPKPSAERSPRFPPELTWTNERPYNT